MVEERRKFKRFSLPLTVGIGPADSAQTAQGTIKDFSREGMSLVTKQFEFAIKSPLALELSHPHSGARINAYGDVMWKKQVDDTWEAGIRFTSIDKVTKQDMLSYAYEHWVEKMRSQQSPAS